MHIFGRSSIVFMTFSSLYHDFQCCSKVVIWQLYPFCCKKQHVRSKVQPKHVKYEITAARARASITSLTHKNTRTVPEVDEMELPEVGNSLSFPVTSQTSSISTGGTTDDPFAQAPPMQKYNVAAATNNNGIATATPHQYPTPLPPQNSEYWTHISWRLYINTRRLSSCSLVCSLVVWPCVCVCARVFMFKVNSISYCGVQVRACVCMSKCIVMYRMDRRFESSLGDVNLWRVMLHMEAGI